MHLQQSRFNFLLLACEVPEDRSTLIVSNQTIRRLTLFTKVNILGDANRRSSQKVGASTKELKATPPPQKKRKKNSYEKKKKRKSAVGGGSILLMLY